MRQLAMVGMVAVVVLAVAGGCRRVGPPVAVVEVSPLSIDLSYPHFVMIDLNLEPLADLAGLEGEPLVFVHLLDEPGSVLRTFDHPLPAAWKVGEPQRYQLRLYQSALVPPLAPRTYLLSIGLYDRAGHRWPLRTSGEEVDRHEYTVARVVVPEEDRDTPMFYFSSTWLPIEGGADLNVLARRWLPETGEIRAGKVSRTGTVWMRLRIPDPAGADQTLELAAGADHPQVEVSTDCGSSSVSIAGSGSHDVELELEAAPAGGDCMIRIVPNYHLVMLPSLARFAVELENLGWRPAPATDDSAPLQ